MSNLSQFGSGGINPVQRFNGSGTWNAGGPVGTSGLYIDVPINQVNAAKTRIIPNRTAFSGADGQPHPINYFLHAAGNMVRCVSFENSTQPGYYGFEVLEYKT